MNSPKRSTLADAPKRLRSLPWFIVLGLIVVAVMIYSLVAGSRMTTRHLPLVSASQQVKVEVSLAHLWFEEIISGDPHEKISTVWDHLDRAAGYGQVMLEGAESSGVIFLSLTDPELKSEIEELNREIAEFRETAETRWQDQATSGVGSEIDQQFDRRFDDLFDQAAAVEAILSLTIAQELARYKTVQVFLILLCLLLTGLVAYVLRRYERRRALDLAAGTRFTRVLESSLNEIYLFDPDTLRFVEVNRGARRNLGYSIEELRELTPLSIKPFITPEQFAEIIAPLRNSDRETIRFDTVHQRKDGTQYPVDVSLQLAHEEPAVFVAIILDVTDRVEAEESRDLAEKQLRQAQKMEAVGQLAGGIAHDFNNLLQAIIGYAEMAKMGFREEDPRLSDLKEVLRGAERAAALTRQLLAFSRRQVLELQNLDLNQVTDNLLKLIRRLIGEHITLDFIPGHNLGTVHADAGQMEQVLMNLCINSRDAMPDGGLLTIETENVLVDSAYVRAHPWAVPGRYVLLSITDTGAGMDQQTLAKAFDPFFTTKEVNKGTGLGLATVYGIVKQHGGMAHIYSEVGKGTRFKIYLPLVEQLAMQVPGPVEGAARGGTETILVAEDDQSVREFAVRLLEEAGYTVYAACDGLNAVALYQAHAPEISFALLDVVMPGLSGRLVLDKIRAIDPEVAVLFSSGYSANAIHTGFVLDEGMDLIQKPFAPQELLRRVRSCIDRQSTFTE